MSAEKLAGCVKGYVEFCADGFFCERFLNICMHRDIFLWNVKRHGENRISACISAENFRLLRSVARKTGTKVSIVKRVGVPFFLRRYRKRKTLIAGMALSMIVLWYFSTHIVGIDIEGNERISTEELMLCLKKSGIYYGTTVRNIDRNFVKNRMMTECDELAWIGINVKGSRAYIEVKERLDTKLRLDGDVPCDLVAERSGKINLLEIKDGQTMVTVGQFVEEGDLLASGIVDSEKEGMRYVHSFGSVFAETTFEKTEEYPLEYVEKIYTGKKKIHFSASVFGKNFRFFVRDTQPFEYCDSEEIEKEYKTKWDMIPSVFVKEKRFLEYTPQKKTRSIAATVETAKKEMFSKLDSELPPDVEVKDKKVTYERNGEKSVLVTVEYLCVQDIARQRMIDKIDNLGYDVK